MGESMPRVVWFYLGSFLVAGVGQLYYWVKAVRNLSDEPRPQLPPLFLWPWFSQRRDFTEKGWRYRQRAVRLWALPLVMFVLIALFQNWLL